MTIRPAVPADLPEVMQLERACYGDPWPSSAFASLPDNTRVYFAVASSGVPTAVVGYVIAWYVLDEGELANIAVAAEARGSGIGGRLLDAVLADAGSRGVREMYLEVRDSNTSARRLYDARGFRQVGRRADYYRRPTEDALILCRTLTPSSK